MLCALLATLPAFAQFPPPAGQPGTTALAVDSSAFVAWAMACMVQRGPQDISNTDLGLATTGDESMATGVAGTNGVVSLGDGGTAILTFAQPITNGPGWDFAVFENSFSDTFLELAFVEVSSNGTDFFRFPCTSNTQTETQVDGFGETDATELDNFAGKYRGGFGTPFDLEQLAGTAGLDLDAITHVKLVDVGGCIQEAYATHDRNGHAVNDPWSTPFASSGFDLDAVGVINQGTLGFPENGPVFGNIELFPNPASGATRLSVTLQEAGPLTIALIDAQGRNERTWRSSTTAPGTQVLDLEGLPAGTHFVDLRTPNARTTRKLIIVP